MALPTDILLVYGYLLIFAWVLVEQLGIPLPSVPILLAAGALSAEKQISFPLALAVAVAASLTADSIWFFVGRSQGHRVLRLLCKLSLDVFAVLSALWEAAFHETFPTPGERRARTAKPQSGSARGTSGTAVRRTRTDFAPRVARPG